MAGTVMLDLREFAKASPVTTHRPACRKLQDKGGQISDVRNIAQLLVVIHLPEDHNAMLFGSAVQYCYHVMGLVHAKWAPIPGAIKVGQDAHSCGTELLYS